MTSSTGSHYNYDTSQVHIDTLRYGDTVLRNGQLLTLSRSNYKRSGFMGSTIEGDSYRAGMDLVPLVHFRTNK